jgi:hypothetical protein
MDPWQGSSTSEDRSTSILTFEKEMPHEEFLLYAWGISFGSNGSFGLGMFLTLEDWGPTNLESGQLFVVLQQCKRYAVMETFNRKRFL